MRPIDLEPIDDPDGIQTDPWKARPYEETRKQGIADAECVVDGIRDDPQRLARRCLGPEE